ncbi:ABC transporter ATP-binding protein [Nocardioides sp. Kera G14]|uniref:ABC transporter ATP-binding protein n=1 Tax=Nocardioides sp. Kera G14 TaxID=2884264 RepID=UPI001D1140C4|nr:ABC transporter ATP-binding protein [Nocardioides sp. Kera G14]UDY24535.1 ATP-binding cassette domain-containing protein [Nocardioides sp. Kera G14]
MIELRHVSVALPDRPAPVLDGVDLTIAAGELVVLAGPTGAGKSTLLGVVSGLVPRFTGGSLTGDVLLDGVSILHAPPRERAEVIGVVGQDPVAGFVTDTVDEELAYGMEQLGLAPSAMRRRVEETLDLLGIAELRTRDLRTLSGGQQQRVALGSVLTMHPRLLVLDEPTSALDPTAAEDVLATVSRLVEDVGVSVLMAEHRLERVVPFADRIALLRGDGRLEIGDPAEVLATSPVAPPLVELGRLLDLDPLPLTVREARKAVRAGWEGGAARVPQRAERARMSEIAAPPSQADRTAEAKALRVVRGATEVLKGLDLILRAGEIAALMGRNGSGKSTLLWTLQGSQARRAGSVEIDGTDPAAVKPEQRRRLVGLLPQTASDLLYLETVAEECADGGPKTRELLDRLVPGIDDDTHPRDLSEGQQLALALALVLAGDPPVILLDEPTRGLDYAAKSALADILHSLAAEGRSVLVATHDVEFAAHIADRVLVLAEGELISDGPAHAVLTESPAFAPQVTKVLGAPWLTVEDVRRALEAEGAPA